LLELKVPGLGAWSIAGIVSLVLGGLTLFNGAGGVRVSPLVIAPVAAMVTLFFGFVVTKMMAIRTMPPPQGIERLIGREGVVIGAGLSPDGIVRVAAEEWRAASTAESPLPPGSRVRVTSVQGLRLTVEPVGEVTEASATTGTSPSSSKGGSST
jgi:membrane-bound ClpP family serine protease